MRFRLLLCALLLAFLGVAGGGTWWFLHRRPDPAVHAAAAASRGDLRETLLLERAQAAQHPNDTTLRLQLGQHLLQFGDAIAAEKTFRAADEQGADHWLATAGLAEADAIQAKWTTLLDDVPDSGAPEPTMSRLLLWRATAKVALDDVAGAQADMQRVKAAHPDGPEAPLIAAMIATHGRDAAAADAALDAALQADPMNVSALTLKLDLLTRRPDGTAAALAMADRAAAAAPWSRTIRLIRADLLMRAGGQDAKAQQDLDFVLALTPRSVQARYLDAVLMARAGHNEQAAAAFEKLGPAVEQFPRGFFIQAVVNLRIGNAQLASTLAERFNARYPADTEGVLLLAQARLASHQEERVVPQLELWVGAARAANRPVDPAALRLLGDAYSAMGNEPAALRVREQAAKLAPEDRTVLRDLGVSQLRQGDISAGLDTLDRSAAMGPVAPAVSEGLFRAALGAGDIERAAAVLARRRAQDGNTPVVALMAAIIQQANGDRDAAQKAMQDLLRDHPDFLPVRIDLAQLLALQGHPDDALALVHDVLAKEPANPGALAVALPIWEQAKSTRTELDALAAAEAAAPTELRLVAVHADALTRSGDPAAALALLDRKRTGGALPPPLLLAEARAQTAAQQPEKALDTYRDLLQANPANAQIRSAQVGLLMSLKRVDEAKASVREGLARAPGSFGLQRGLVQLELQSGGLDPALKLAASLRARPDSMPAAALLQGDLLMAARQYDRAAQAYRSEFDQAPAEPLALRLAAAEVAADHRDAAATLLRTWLTTHPDSPDAVGALARLDEAAGRFDLAIDELEARLHRRPNDAVALNDLAWIYQTHNDPRARALAQRAYQLSQLPQIADTLAWIMLQQGEAQPAAALLQKAAAARPDDPALAYHLASAMQKTGRASEGAAVLEPALAKAGPFPERPAAEKLLRELKGG